MHTISELRLLLDSLGHRPKKSLGQNFLVDGNILEKCVAWADICHGDAVVEIGAGLGTLTQALLEAGAEVFAVERDERLAQYLTETLGRRFKRSFFLKIADAVRFPLAGLPEGRQHYCIVANLPYAIITPWLDGVLSSPILPEKMVLMLQKEAADRLLANHGSKAYSPMSIFLNGLFECTQRYVVSRECFFPRPAVTSELVLLTRKTTQVRFPKDIRDWIRAVFSQRRKQLRNALNNAANPLLSQLFTDALHANGYQLTDRAEDIPYAVWAALGAVK